MTDPHTETPHQPLQRVSFYTKNIQNINIVGGTMVVLVRGCNATIQQWVTNNSHQSQHLVAHMVDLVVVVPCCPCSVLILISTACDEYNTQQFCNFVILQHVFVFFVFPLFQLFSPQRVALTTSHPRRRSLCRCPVFSCEICF